MLLDLFEFFVRHVEAFFVVVVIAAVLAQLPALDQAIRTFRNTYRARASKL